MESSKLGVQTLAIHAGEEPDPVTKAASPNLVMSTTYVTGADVAFSIEGAGEDDPYVYTRWSNPTVDQLAEKLAILEGAEAGLCFASGMAAISALFLHFLDAGDRLVMSDVAYAVSLGHHRSLIFYLDTAELLQISFRLNEAQQASYRHFAGDGIFRVSVGLEDAADLCGDLEQALAAL